MKFFGVLFLALLLSTILVFVDIKLPGAYLTSFINNSFIETFAAIVGFNLASVTFLLGQLITIEATTNRVGIFESTRKEIRHNAYFLLISFVSTLLILIVRSSFKDAVPFITNFYYYACNVVVMAIFFMALYAIYEILKAIFSVGRFFNAQSDKKS